MRKLIIIALALSLVLVGCTAPNSDRNTVNAPDLHLGETLEDQSSQTDPTESLTSAASGPMTSDSAPTTPTVPDPSENSTDETNAPQQATETPTTPTVPIEETKPTPTAPPETTPTQPQETEPEETQTATEPEETAPQINQNFKQQVAQYAAQYINLYRAATGVGPCEVLPGMTLVAEYRANQLTRNYAHDTADQREALDYYQYGRWIDATIVGLAPEDSYYEADAAEAICAGFEGKTAEEIGKYIADLCRNSSSHWSYVGSSKFSYIGIGVDYRAGTAYGWYGCVMVGRTNYG